jgi:cobalamin biosynthesis protein CobW
VEKVPVTIITGFLGAGKTTLIRNMILGSPDMRFALLINEFGDTNIDSELLLECTEKRCCQDIIELSDNCICCTITEDFVPAIKKLTELQNKAPLDHIIIETSGLAFPQPLIAAFNWPEVYNRVTLNGVITVVDGTTVVDLLQNKVAPLSPTNSQPATSHETAILELHHSQMCCSDLIILNKVDLMNNDEIDTARKSITSNTDENARIVCAREGHIAPDVLFGHTASHKNRSHHHDEDHHDDDHHDHHHGDFYSVSIEVDEIEHLDAFKEKIQSLLEQHRILRLKGFALVKGKPMRLVIQAVGQRLNLYFDRLLTNEDREKSKIVAISDEPLSEKTLLDFLSF